MWNSHIRIDWNTSFCLSLHLIKIWSQVKPMAKKCNNMLQRYNIIRPTILLHYVKPMGKPRCFTKTSSSIAHCLTTIGRERKVQHCTHKRINTPHTHSPNIHS